MEQSRMTLAQLAKATRVKPRNIKFATRWCGLKLELPRRKGDSIYTPADVATVRQWFADADNCRAVTGTVRLWAGHGSELAR